MIYIAHRGLIDGPNVKIENHPDTLEKAFGLGYDCEIDIWFIDGKPVLGHDSPQYEVTPQYVLDNSAGAWFHCKNFEALDWFNKQSFLGFEYFWHENDKFTLTCAGYIWTFPNNALGDTSICVLPELFIPIEKCISLDCIGICSDYIGVIRLMRGDV